MEKHRNAINTKSNYHKCEVHSKTLTRSVGVKHCVRKCNWRVGMLSRRGSGATGSQERRGEVRKKRRGEER